MEISENVLVFRFIIFAGLIFCGFRKLIARKDHSVLRPGVDKPGVPVAGNAPDPGVRRIDAVLFHTGQYMQENIARQIFGVIRVVQALPAEVQNRLDIFQYPVLIHGHPSFPSGCKCIYTCIVPAKMIWIGQKYHNKKVPCRTILQGTANGATIADQFSISTRVISTKGRTVLRLSTEPWDSAGMKTNMPVAA